jgi:pyrroloquinoline quinone biosynthesis protein E
VAVRSSAKPLGRRLVPRRVRRHSGARRVAHRLGLTDAPPAPASAPPGRPIGVKLELTARCNLRCGFCYTDSPRQTLERAIDLPDEVWLDVVAQAVDLGVIEAVVTGGEPFLNPDLTLAVLERLDSAGVGVSLNTNGWFIDERIADRLAALDGVFVHISLDGAAPEDHDAARGVPGSWRRAVRAMHLLLERGVGVQAIHVVTPSNQHDVEAFLELCWLLGVRSVRLTAVTSVGAAARGGDWTVDTQRLERAGADACLRFGADMPVRLSTSAEEGVNRTGSVPPGSLLVRPEGTVRTDAVSPFAFGNVRRDRLADCWDRIVTGWDDERIRSWARGAARTSLGAADLVPYRDDEEWIAGEPVPGPERAGNGSSEPVLPEPAASVAAAGPAGPREWAQARSEVAELAFSRRYVLGQVRWTEGTTGCQRLVRVHDRGQVLCLNAQASLVMDACAGGTGAAALDALRARNPEVDPGRLESDVAGALRRLVARGAIRPHLARPGAIADLPVPEPDLPVTED